MSDPVYCLQSDVIGKLPSGGLPNQSKVATGSAAGDYIECEGHGLQEGQSVTFRAAIGGASPAPLVDGTVYFAKNVTIYRFQVAATSGGSPINLTTDGTNFTFRSDLPLDSWIASSSRLIDSVIGETAPHVVPLVADMVLNPSSNGFPPLVVQYCAELTAILGIEKTAGASIDLSQRRDQIINALRAWAKQSPVRGLAAQRQQPVDLAVTDTAGAIDPRGWGGTDDTRIP